MKFPVISLVTPCYNSDKTLEATIQNVISQNYQNLEYVIVDGGSNDNSLDIIKKYSKNISNWISEPDEGQYDAICKGFSITQGEIMGWLNADDLYLPGVLNMVGDIFRSFPEIEWISSLHPGGWDADGLFRGTSTKPGFSRAAFNAGCQISGFRKRAFWIQQESTFWRRSLWERAGSTIPNKYSLAGDYALWSKFYEHADLIGLDYPIAGFRTLQGQRSADVQRYRQEAIKVMQDSNSMPNSFNVACYNFTHAFIYRSGPMKRLFTKLWGYAGKRIYKSDPSIRNAPWVMGEIKYFL